VGVWDIVARARDGGAIKGDAVGLVWGAAWRVCWNRCWKAASGLKERW